MSLADELQDDLATADPYLWLEEVTGTEALDWVRERNAATLASLAESPGFTSLRDEIRQVLDSRERIPYVSRRGGQVYNFWQDEANPRGLRRTTPEEYRKDEPDWEILLDLD